MMACSVTNTSCFFICLWLKCYEMNDVLKLVYTVTQLIFFSFSFFLIKIAIVFSKKVCVLYCKSMFHTIVFFLCMVYFPIWFELYENVYFLKIYLERKL